MVGGATPVQNSFNAGSIVLYSVTLLWYKRPLSIAAYQLVTNTIIMSRQRETGRSTTDHRSPTPRFRKYLFISSWT